jgi:hypothetical protein
MTLGNMYEQGVRHLIAFCRPLKAIQAIERESISVRGAALSLQGFGFCGAVSLQFQFGIPANRKS